MTHSPPPLLVTTQVAIDPDQLNELGYSIAMDNSKLVPLDSIPDFIDFLEMVGYVKRADLENRLSFRVPNSRSQDLNCNNLVVDLGSYQFLHICIGQMRCLHQMLQKLCGKDTIGIIDFWIQDCMTQAKISEERC